MRLSRVRIGSLRQFRDPIEIDGLHEGINLFVGPNGAGKSTIVRAIRAAFFERYSSSSVTDLQPREESGAGPTVEVDFTSGGHRYQLRKRFLSRKRCSLDIDGRLLENAEAEGCLADLLGFQYAGKGASKAEHWGVPGLLWIQQGGGQEIHEAVLHAADHLRKALDESLGEVASTGGDELFERVQAEREKLLTRTGQPTGELREAAGLLSAAQEKLAGLAAQLATYREQVDRFAVLNAQVLAESREQPWRRLDAEARQAQEQLAGIEKAREALATDHALLTQSGAQTRLLEQQQAWFAEQAARLDQRRQAAAGAGAQLADAEQALLPRRQMLDAAQQAQDHAQAALVAAERRAGRRRLLERIAELLQHHARLQGAIAQGREIAARLNRHRQEIAVRWIGTEQLQALRTRDREIQAAGIRLESIATGLSYRLEPGRSIDRDGESLEGSGESQLVRRTVLNIPQIGTVTIEPGGGHDLAQVAGRKASLESTQANLLQSLGLDSIAAAEQRLQECRALEQAAQVEQALLDQLAPKGLEALAAELAAFAGELAAVRSRLAQSQSQSQSSAEEPAEGLAEECADGPAAGSPGERAAARLPGLEEARQLQADASLRLRQAQAAEQAARAACATAKSATQHAEGELAQLEAAVQAEDYQRRVAQNQAELQATRLRYGSLAAKVETVQRSIDAARPQVMLQDAERLARSATQALQAHEQRRNELRDLQWQLDAAGAMGLEEQLAQASADLERIQRRHRELDRRARALDLLAGMLKAKRQALTLRLQAPLLKHLNHYLQVLMPGASVTIDESLKPVALSLGAGAAADRHGFRDSADAAGCFEELSFGTREQISLISRLAYADLLKEANRPTLIILDDCLVNTDTARMSQMKRILYDAATRHQILLFSCHPDRWQDLGTPARQVQSFLKAKLPAEAA
ncbi:MAG: AAA family ATPase [Lautropia sp.]|nr:AAA family ATPase [Lautropia sp.]